MTVVVAYLAGKSGSAPLQLAAATARTLETSLMVATVVPKSWATPSPARVDAEYAAWADRLATDSAREAQQFLTGLSGELDVTYRSYPSRSASAGLLEALSDSEADLLILGSSSNGQLGQVVVGSTAGRLLHSSPVPLGIAPRGYRGVKSARLTRLTCAYPGTPEAVDMVARVAGLAAAMKVPLRVVTFAVEGRSMYPPEVGLHAEDSILGAWEEHARDMFDRLRASGVVGGDVETLVADGLGWDDALDAVEWQDGEMLVLGTSPRADIAHVFLGSRGTKILRHSPVPVLVFPGPARH